MADTEPVPIEAIPVFTPTNQELTGSKEIIEASNGVYKSLQSARYADDTMHRSWLAIWSATIVTLWLIAVLVILWANKSNCGFTYLSDQVLITLLGTSTVNILGLSYIVLKGLFNSNEKPPTA